MYEIKGHFILNPMQCDSEIVKLCHRLFYCQYMKKNVLCDDIFMNMNGTYLQ